MNKPICRRRFSDDAPRQNKCQEPFDLRICLFDEKKTTPIVHSNRSLRIVRNKDGLFLPKCQYNTFMQSLALTSLLPVRNWEKNESQKGIEMRFRRSDVDISKSFIVIVSQAESCMFRETHVHRGLLHIYYSIIFLGYTLIYTRFPIKLRMYSVSICATFFLIYIFNQFRSCNVLFPTFSPNSVIMPYSWPRKRHILRCEHIVTMSTTQTNVLLKVLRTGKQGNATIRQFKS